MRSRSGLIGAEGIDAEALAARTLTDVLTWLGPAASTAVPALTLATPNGADG